MSGRFWAPATSLSLLLLAGCSDDSTAAPAPSSQVLSVDTFNLYLAGSFSPHEAERRQPIIDAIASMETDIVCLQEVWRDSDKDAIAAAAKARFPYAVSFKTTLDTPLDDPTDQNGQIPPAPTEAPCAQTTQKDKLINVINCVQQKCSTIPGSQQGMTTSTECVIAECITEATALLYGDPNTATADRKCYGCAATLLPTDTFQQMLETCTTNKNAGLAFDGQSGVMILSKFPLQNVEQRVIPGTWNRRTILRATANLPSGVAVDVYCNHLPSVFYQPAFPYTGEYGMGETDYKGWQNELMLDAQKLIAWVESKSGSNKAIVLGDFNASPELKDQGIEPDGADAYAYLASKLTEAVPAGFKPACTYCGKTTNPLAGPNGPNTWIDHVFIRNIPVSDVISTARTFVDPVVQVASDAGAGTAKLPLSDHYGVHTVINIQP